MEARIYPNLSADDYHGLDAVSFSRLRNLARSPAHCLEAMRNPPPATDAMRLGSAFHAAALEPARFAAQYVCAGDIDRRTKVGKDEWANLVANHGEGRILRIADYTQIYAMCAAIDSHPAASELVRKADAFEVSAIANDTETALALKARADGVVGDILLFDLKTTVDASPGAFQRTIFGMRYYLQAAHYLETFAAVGLIIPSFAFIAVEKAPPYAIAVYSLDQTALAAGRIERRRLLELYRQCAESGHWPAYSEGIEDLGLPLWAYKQIDIEDRKHGTGDDDCRESASDNGDAGELAAF